MNFKKKFLLWVIFALLDPNPDPLTRLNPDPIRIRIRNPDGDSVSILRRVWKMFTHSHWKLSANFTCFYEDLNSILEQQLTDTFSIHSLHGSAVHGNFLITFPFCSLSWKFNWTLTNAVSVASAMAAAYLARSTSLCGSPILAIQVRAIFFSRTFKT